MKTKFLSIIALAAFGIVAAAACNRPEAEINIAEEVAGSYTGTTSASFQYSPDPMVTEGETFTVTALTDKTVSVSYESSTWGSFTFQDVAVSGSDPYTLKGEGKTLMGMGETKNEYAATLDGTIGAKTGSVEFLITVPAVMGGLTIEFTLAE